MVGIAAAAALALTACGSPEAEQAQESAPASDAAPVQSEELLVEHGLDGFDAVGIVDHLDLLPVEERPTDLVASVRPDVLVLSDGAEGQEIELDLPEDRFYLSMAPYVDHTHECFHHSLTSCMGELRGEEIAVTITDDSDGSVLVEEEGRTFDNGFVGYWLPSGIDATVTVEYEDRSGSTRVSTGADDPTCLTSLELV